MTYNLMLLLNIEINGDGGIGKSMVVMKVDGSWLEGEKYGRRR